METRQSIITNQSSNRVNVSQSGCRQHAHSLQCDWLASSRLLMLTTFATRTKLANPTSTIEMFETAERTARKLGLGRSKDEAKTDRATQPSLSTTHLWERTDRTPGEHADRRTSRNQAADSSSSTQAGRNSTRYDCPRR